MIQHCKRETTGREIQTLVLPSYPGLRLNDTNHAFVSFQIHVGSSPKELYHAVIEGFCLCRRSGLHCSIGTRQQLVDKGLTEIRNKMPIIAQSKFCAMMRFRNRQNVGMRGAKTDQGYLEQ